MITCVVKKKIAGGTTFTIRPPRLNSWLRHWAEAREGEGVARAGLVINTCRVLEGEFIDAVAEHAEFKGQKLFPVGPLNPLMDASATPGTPGKAR